MKTLTVGSYDITCRWCNTPMLTIRAGRMNLTTKMARVFARCERCNETQRQDVKLELTDVEKLAEREKAQLASKRASRQGKPAKKRRRKASRTVADLVGRCEGEGKRKTWRFTYPTKYATLMLVMKKYMGNWQAHFGDRRMGSGKTMKEALEQAKRRMHNCGYELVEIDF